MVRKKKEEYEDIEEVYDDNDDEFDYERDSSTPPEFDAEPDSSLALANQISKESDTVKFFKEMPREVKYSFYNNEDKKEVKHYSRAYRTHKYIEKVIDLRIKEDERLRHARMKINTIKDIEDLKEYFRKCNRGYLINDIVDLNKSDVEKLLKHVKKLKKNYLLDTVEENKSNMSSLYKEYSELHSEPDYIDDMGNVGKIVDTSLTSMGYKGNASQHSVMTIQAVKNEDISNKASETRKFGFMDAIKNKFG